MRIVTKTDINVLPLLSRGKVRDIYEIDERTLLIVTTDRMSAFDVILKEPVPYKGVVLNQLTLFWMEKFDSIIPNHILEAHINDFPAKLQPFKEELEGRAVIARKAKTLPVECIVRGYLSGSGWKDYQETGKLCGYELPPGLMEADRLEPALFTPSTKAMEGEHDENIDVFRMAALVGDEAMEKARAISLEIYNAGRAFADSKGIILADTKFEFGFIDGTLHLIDEVMTPDSSRFWPKDAYKPGQPQPSFDKQFLRDWLKAQPWNKKAPPPVVPEEIIDITGQKYMEAYRLLTGQKLNIN